MSTRRETRQRSLYNRSRSRSRSRSPIRDVQSKKLQDTEFTFGIEYEPTKLHYFDHNQGHHYDREIIHTSKKTKVTIEKYDTEKIIKNEIKKISKSEENKDEKSDIELIDKTRRTYKNYICSYNIELSIGTFTFDKISEFIDNPLFYIDELKENVDIFEEYIKKDNDEFLDMRKKYNSLDFFNKMEFDQNVGNLRQFSNINKTGINIFKDCSRMVSYDDPEYSNLNISYLPINLDGIKGRPQITIGLSYGFLEGLVNLIFSSKKSVRHKDTAIVGEIYMDSYFEYENVKIILDQMDYDSFCVLRGFLFLIIYSSHIKTQYLSEGAGGTSKYLKSNFSIKPRTNLAESYTNLIRDYPSLRKPIRLYYDFLSNYLDILISNIKTEFNVDIPKFDFIPIQGTYLGNPMYSNVQFMRYKLDDVFDRISRGKEKINKDIKKIYMDSKKYPYECQDEFKYNCQFERIMDCINQSELDKESTLFYFFMTLEQKFMLFNMYNPVDVVKIIITDKSKIGNSCPILDKYLYSYIEGEDRNRINSLVEEGFIEIVSYHKYAGQPPILYKYKDSETNTYNLCGNFREELFEWVPENNTSNLIVELRSPENITTFKGNDSISISNIKLFYTEVLNNLSSNFRKTINMIQPSQIQFSESSMVQSQYRSELVDPELEELLNF